MSEAPIVLNETIHQSTRLRIMTLLMSQSNSERVAYGFIQQTLGLTGGNIVTTKEFVDAKPRTWVETTREGLRAFSDYLANLQRTLNMSR